MIRLAKYLKKFRKQVIIGPIFKLLEAVFELIIPLVMSAIIDNGVANGDRSYIYRMGGLMLGLGIIGLGFALICQYSAAVASQGVGTTLRNELFLHINSLSHKEIDQMGTNSLITRITNDVNQVQLAVAMLIRLVVRAPFIVIGSTVMAIILDLQMSVIFMLIIPVITLILYLVMSKSIPYYTKRQKTLDEVSLVTREGLEGTRVIRAFSKQKAENQRFLRASEEVTATAVKVGNISAILNPATFTVLNIGIIAILWFGGIRVDMGSLTQGQIIALVSYTTQISLTLIVVANVVVIFTKASVSAARINEVFDMKPSVQEMGSEGKETEGMQSGQKPDIHQIEFQEVYFSYGTSGGSDAYVLEDISFSVDRGETIGIIGGTGSGKSTMVNLIPRFYDAVKGKVLVDGRDVKDYRLKELRHKFGIVPQRAVLFEGTILENLRWAAEEATLDEVGQAVAAAQAVDVVASKEGGLEAHISQGGKNLSGGQKQRLTVARALVGKPEILILDDSSSALDYATDARLRHALRELDWDMTVLIVSQRANSIKHADKIIVLAEGQVAGIGTHEELLDTCSEYREICLSQLSEEEVRRA